MSEWIAVVSEEGEEPIEIPTESDGTMLLSTLSAQFPKVTGLKFRNPESNLLRGVRCHDNTLFPPIPPNPEAGEAGGAGSWGGHTYICTMPPSAMKMVSKKVHSDCPTWNKSRVSARFGLLPILVFFNDLEIFCRSAKSVSTPVPQRRL